MHSWVIMVICWSLLFRHDWINILTLCTSHFIAGLQCPNKSDHTRHSFTLLVFRPSLITYGLYLIYCYCSHIQQYLLCVKEIFTHFWKLLHPVWDYFKTNLWLQIKDWGVNLLKCLSLWFVDCCVYGTSVLWFTMCISAHS